MNGIKKIMVALEFTELSEEVFIYAAGLASRLDAQLIVANVIDSRDVDAVSRIANMGYGIESGRYVKEMKSERKQLLDDMISKSSFSSNRVKEVFKVGRPANELLKVAVKEQVDMIVMGLKAHTEFEHFFVGSVADKLFRRSPVTLVSYRSKKQAARLKKRILGD
ncbi:MAG: universal stress protein [Thermodesulfobacteriota bacterium]